jgi:hypothetical protein
VRVSVRRVRLRVALILASQWLVRQVYYCQMVRPLSFRAETFRCLSAKNAANS